MNSLQGGIVLPEESDTFHDTTLAYVSSTSLRTMFFKGDIFVIDYLLFHPLMNYSSAYSNIASQSSPVLLN